MGPEQVGSPARLEPLPLLGRAVRLEPVVARELGLVNGQVVEAVVANRDGRLMLEWAGRFWPLPQGVSAKTGELVSLRIQFGALTVWLIPQRGPVASPAIGERGRLESPAHGRERGAGAISTQFPPLLLALLAAPASAPSALLRALTLLLNSQAKPLHLDHRSGVAEGQGLAGRWAGGLASLRELTAKQLRLGLLQSGLFFESSLSRKRTVSDFDVKRMLLQVLRHPSHEAGVSDPTSELLAGLQRQQAEALLAQQQRHLDWCWLMPFLDGPPMAFRLQKEVDALEEARATWVMEVHAEWAELGPIWMRCRYQTEGALDIIIWAPEAKTAALARGGEADLRLALSESKLRLHGFRVLAFCPPEQTAGQGISGAHLEVQA